MTKGISLTQGKVAIVDDEDYEELNKHKWYAQRRATNYYAVRNVRDGFGKYTLQMHRQILGLIPGDGKICDHINRVTLDNRTSNLRIVNKAGNNRNHNGYSHNTSGHNGVSWNKNRHKWEAYVHTNSKCNYLGVFESLEDAIQARREGELINWGYNGCQ